VERTGAVIAPAETEIIVEFDIGLSRINDARLSKGTVGSGFVE
jgi:hypothetical protein